MLAYRMTDWGAPPKLVEVPDPVPGPGETLVRVAGCGLCRSDLTMRHLPAAVGEQLGWSMPFTLGHEVAGWIDGTGEPVALVSPTSCGVCRYCVRGQDSGCPHGRAGRGYGRDGGLAQFVLVADRRALLPLGALDPRHAGPLTDAGATAYHAVRRALPRIPAGGTVVVIGAGGLGAFAIQFVRVLTAARVVAVDPLPARLSYAAEIGAHSGVPEVSGKADVVLDFVGTDETIAAGIAAVRTGGAYGLIGSADGRLRGPWFSTLPRDGEVFTFQGSSIADAQEVIALAGAGLIRNQVVEFGLGEIDRAYAELASGGLTGRAVIVP
ncbi:NAD(P)-dependent alcohol dehydrogenase [Actinoplanes sichuanensis]|nr:NAD(P)-dependent alcohol dehydrogenase [Actinoplanes sichuanensis]